MTGNASVGGMLANTSPWERARVGFENRDYIREGDYTGTLAGWGLDYISPVVKWLIVANVIVWLLQIFLTRQYTLADWQKDLDSMPRAMRQAYDTHQREAAKSGEEAKGNSTTTDDSAVQNKELPHEFFEQKRVSIVEDWLALGPRMVVYRGQVWRLVTYAFCHERTWVMHILFNMLALFWFGVTLETMYGQREFLLFYLAAAVVSGIAHVALGLLTGSGAAAIGASGAVMAVLMLYAIHYPRHTIRIFWFFPLEVRWIVVLYVIYDLHPLLLALAGDELYSNVAHAAHLGGLAFGFVYWKLDLQLERYWDKLPKLSGAGTRRRQTIAPIRRSAEQQQDQDVDEILRKIADSGEASLTDQERRTLQRAAERYKRKHS
ncbi:MAG: rhomboid family intramembrane serine protease [Planctomycetaceae bacterium]|nr:rhomboid family intramembrane serine protease [Planctomycetaceae bacterium]